MRNGATAIKVVVKLYKWRILALALALIFLLFSRGSVIAEYVKPPPGSAPAPNIDPL